MDINFKDWLCFIILRKNAKQLLKSEDLLFHSVIGHCKFDISNKQLGLWKLISMICQICFI